jgi:Zn-dependent alcohol dehydrogenase
VRVTAAVMEEKSGMLELDTIELETPRPDRLITFYDFAAISQAAADAVGGAALKPVLRMPQ